MFSIIVEGTNPGHRGKVSWISRSGATERRVRTPTRITANKWSHVCGIETGSNRQIFLDMSEGSNSGPISVTGLNRASIGRRYLNGLTLDLFRGGIAHVAVWNVALSVSEVSSLANGVSPLALHVDNLVAHWPLNGQSPELEIVSRVDMALVGGPPVAEEPPLAHSIVAPP
jgi:hypothetical protein